MLQYSYNIPAYGAYTHTTPHLEPGAPIDEKLHQAAMLIAKTLKNRETGCDAFFCAVCLLRKGGGNEARSGRLTKRKGVVPQAKRRETQDAARRRTKALGRTRSGHLCRRRAVESGAPESDPGRD